MRTSWDRQTPRGPLRRPLASRSVVASDDMGHGYIFESDRDAINPIIGVPVVPGCDNLNCQASRSNSAHEVTSSKRTAKVSSWPGSVIAWRALCCFCSEPCRISVGPRATRRRGSPRRGLLHGPLAGLRLGFRPKMATFSRSILLNHVPNWLGNRQASRERGPAIPGPHDREYSAADACRRVRLITKALELPRIKHGREGQHLEGHAPAQRNLLGLVHHAHAATAYLADQPKVAERADDFVPIGDAGPRWPCLRGD